MGLELRGVICSSSTTWTAAEAHRNEDHSKEELNKRVMGEIEDCLHL